MIGELADRVRAGLIDLPPEAAAEGDADADLGSESETAKLQEPSVAPEAATSDDSAVSDLIAASVEWEESAPVPKPRQLAEPVAPEVKPLRAPEPEAAERPEQSIVQVAPKGLS